MKSYSQVIVNERIVKVMKNKYKLFFKTKSFRKFMFSIRMIIMVVRMELTSYGIVERIKSNVSWRKRH